MLMEVRDLCVTFQTARGKLHAVNHLSFTLDRGESLGFVGESGCGKSTLMLAVMQLLANNGAITEGSIVINGKNMVGAPYDMIRTTRWKDISIAFQNVMTALNPVQKIGVQIINALKEHEQISDEKASQRAENIFRQVGLAPSRLMQYPHEFSGGMKQRAVLALALICYPKILIADEPTTALDVIAQRQVLDLLVDLKNELGVALIMISHDISSVSLVCKKTAVMYAGQIMEYGPTRDVLIHSRHPYTNALVRSFPSLYRPLRQLKTIGGTPPNLLEQKEQCPFAPRCEYAEHICHLQNPALRELLDGRYCRCHFAGQLNFNQEVRRGE